MVLQVQDTEGAKYIVELGTKLDKVVVAVDKSKKATTEAKILMLNEIH